MNFTNIDYAMVAFAIAMVAMLYLLWCIGNAPEMPDEANDLHTKDERIDNYYSKWNN